MRRGRAKPLKYSWLGNKEGVEDGSHPLLSDLEPSSEALRCSQNQHPTNDRPIYDRRREGDLIVII